MTGKTFDKTRLILLCCGLLYAVLAVAAASADYPTPRRIAEERLRKAFLLANALDTSIRPYEELFTADPNARFEALGRQDNGKFGQAFAAAGLDAAYLDDMQHMQRDRILLCVFTGLSVVAIFALLHVVWLYLRGGPSRA